MFTRNTHDLNYVSIDGGMNYGHVFAMQYAIPNHDYDV